MTRRPNTGKSHNSDLKPLARKALRAAPNFAVLIVLAACATKPEPVIRTVEVKIPVAVACVPKSLAKAPTYPDTAEALKASPGAADRYQLLAAGRLLRTQRLAEIEPVIEACR
jgi:hypothetical protein